MILSSPSSPTSVASGIFHLPQHTISRTVPRVELKEKEETSADISSAMLPTLSSLVSLSHKTNSNELTNNVRLMSSPKKTARVSTPFFLPTSSSSPSTLRKITYMRSRTGDSFDIIRTPLSSQSIQRARPRSSPSPTIPLPAVLPQCPLGDFFSSSSALMKTCQSPIRGHDPG